MADCERTVAMQLNADDESPRQKEIQEANAFLRERYLYLISSLCGLRKCNISMYDNTNVEGSIQAFDLNCDNIIVKDLKTPLQQTIESAILRTSDIKTIVFM